MNCRKFKERAVGDLEREVMQLVAAGEVRSMPYPGSLPIEEATDHTLEMTISDLLAAVRRDCPDELYKALADHAYLRWNGVEFANTGDWYGLLPRTTLLAQQRYLSRLRQKHEFEKDCDLLKIPSESSLQRDESKKPSPTHKGESKNNEGETAMENTSLVTRAINAGKKDAQAGAGLTMAHQSVKMLKIPAIAVLERQFKGIPVASFARTVLDTDIGEGAFAMALGALLRNVPDKWTKDERVRFVADQLSVWGWYKATLFASEFLMAPLREHVEKLAMSLPEQGEADEVQK